MALMALICPPALLRSPKHTYLTQIWNQKAYTRGKTLFQKYAGGQIKAIKAIKATLIFGTIADFPPPLSKHRTQDIAFAPTTSTCESTRCPLLLLL
jgi:hypothetical protein